jgi:hypothetical protein
MPALYVPHPARPSTLWRTVWLDRDAGTICRSGHHHMIIMMMTIHHCQMQDRIA